MTASSVLVVALDGLELSLVLAERETFPTFSSLLSSGLLVPLRPPAMPFSQGHWTTTLTGRRTEAHGVFLPGRQLRPGSYEVDQISFDPERQRPLWGWASDAGIPTTVVGIKGTPLLHPFNGLQALDWGTDAAWGPRFHPPSVARDLAQAVGRRPPGFPGFPQNIDEYRAYRNGLVDGIRHQARGIETLLDRGEWELFVGAFSEPHQAGHMLWHLWDPSHPAHDPDTPPDVREGLKTVYRAADQALGGLLHHGGDATALVFSSSGMGPNPPSADPTSAVLERGGWLTRATRPEGGRWRAWGLAKRTARLVPPAVRARLGRRIPRDRWNDALWLSSIRWESTRAFPLPSDGTSLIRINLQGREPRGVVGRGVEYDHACKQIADAFGELQVAETGLPAVAGVERIGPHDPDLGLPDLVVTWTAPNPIPRVRSPSLGMVEVAPSDPRTGMHTPGGFLLARGEGIPTGIQGAPASQLDLAPTVLARLGIPIPEVIEGRPIPSIG